MGYIDSFVEGIAQDLAIDKLNGFAEEKFNCKDPYRYETAEGKTKKLKLRECATKEEQKEWKWVQKRAWLDDKCFMGCYPVDCGVGLGPLVVAIPCIGPILMYAVHARLTTRAGMNFKLDSKTVAKLQANILFDLLLSLPPIIGSFFTWMNGCSTRNAAIIYNEIDKRLAQREREQTYGVELHDVNTQTTGPNIFSFHKKSKPNTDTKKQGSNTSQGKSQGKSQNKSQSTAHPPQNARRPLPPNPQQGQQPVLPPRDFL